MLHELIAGHAQTMFAELRDDDTGRTGLPRYVERELAEYLRCGILAHGFARVRSQACADELVVAFSCKRRGICPSCTARRMADTAAHLVDHVLPRAPYRQWVFTVPKALRLRLAREPAWASWVGGLAVKAVGAWQRRVARARGIRAPKTGAITFVQRFGGLVNLNVHFHLVVPDGVFVAADGGGLAFVMHPVPTRADVLAILDRACHTRRARPTRRVQQAEGVTPREGFEVIGPAQIFAGSHDCHEVFHQDLPAQRGRHEAVGADTEVATAESPREVLQRAPAAGVESSKLDDVGKVDVVGHVRAAITTDADPRSCIARKLIQKAREFRGACSRDVAFAGHARFGGGEQVLLRQANAHWSKRPCTVDGSSRRPITISASDWRCSNRSNTSAASSPADRFGALAVEPTAREGLSLRSFAIRAARAVTSACANHRTSFSSTVGCSCEPSYRRTVEILTPRRSAT